MVAAVNYYGGLNLSVLDSRSSRIRGLPLFLCWTSMQELFHQNLAFSLVNWAIVGLTSLPLLTHLGQGLCTVSVRCQQLSVAKPKTDEIINRMMWKVVF